MKNIEVIHDTVLYYISLFGRREKTIVEREVVVQPESEQEQLELFFRYHQARKDHLLKLQQLSNKLIQIEHEIDHVNKVQISKVEALAETAYKNSKWYLKPFIERHISRRLLAACLIDKTSIMGLIKRVDELVNLLIDYELALPMREFDYVTLNNINYFVDFVYRSFDDMIIATKQRAELLNVPF